ncbi:MAG TPA: Rrf2 family transcriptional regulator [Phycisphaerales bacterium]|nr:Rrf2 family transcriptional regulator [Phycisphaerales bacterium]
MKLSKRSEYAIKSIVRLAAPTAATGGRGKYVQSREIAEREHLPAKFLESILLVLRSAGFLESKVGVGGGYRLRMPPEQIRIADVISAMEQDQHVVHELSPEPTPGELAMQHLDQRISHAVEEATGELSLASLLGLSTTPHAAAQRA